MKTKKCIKQWLFVVLVGFFAVSCFDDITKQNLPPMPVAFTYKAIDNDCLLDFYIYTTIQFISTSSLQGEHTWNFGDGTIVTSERNEPVTHYFSAAGNHNVTLTVEGRSRRQSIMIQDIVPILSVEPVEGGIHVVLETPVNILVEFPNPQNLSVEYTWFFPPRAFRENDLDNAIVTYEGEHPGALIFGNVGLQQVRLRIRLGGRPLREAHVLIPIGFV